MREEIERISEENELCQRQCQIPGFGPPVASATLASIGNGVAFRRERDFAAWVGALPRQYSTGEKQKLLSISKRGNIYLRRMLIHGARAVRFRVKYDTDLLWFPLQPRGGPNENGARHLPDRSRRSAHGSRTLRAGAARNGSGCSTTIGPTCFDVRAFRAWSVSKGERLYSVS